MNYVVATYLIRFFGVLLIIPALFPMWFINNFPGLEDRRISWVLFIIGITVYVGASIAYHILRKKELAKRRAEMEELK
jgi:predicted membrane channel-forming protein YqfA (hemolysin III family)